MMVNLNTAFLYGCVKYSLFYVATLNTVSTGRDLSGAIIMNIMRNGRYEY